MEANTETNTLPHDPALRGHLLAARGAYALLQKAERDADRQRELFRAAIHRSQEAGASLRVMAAALGITYGRVQQILGAAQQLPEEEEELNRLLHGPGIVLSDVSRIKELADRWRDVPGLSTYAPGMHGLVQKAERALRGMRSGGAD